MSDKSGKRTGGSSGPIRTTPKKPATREARMEKAKDAMVSYARDQASKAGALRKLAGMD
jgi:hypothetical protein